MDWGEGRLFSSEFGIEVTRIGRRSLSDKLNKVSNKIMHLWASTHNSRVVGRWDPLVNDVIPIGVFEERMSLDFIRITFT